jgi:hypothetical protein
MVSRVMRRLGFCLALSALPVCASAQDAHVFVEGRGELAAVQVDGDLPGCSGLMVAPDMVLTARDCVLQMSGEARGHVSVLPGLHMSSGTSSSEPAWLREFAVSAHSVGDHISILRIGQIEGRAPYTSVMEVPSSPEVLSPGEPVDVVYFTEEARPVQTFTTCAVKLGDHPVGMLDCTLPSMAKGAPLLREGTPIGVIINPSLAGGAIYERLSPLSMDASEKGTSTDLPIQTFTGVDVLNTCDVDIHQGVFWLDLDGETWRDLAKRVPANTQIKLPVATIGDSIFSYARTDDGKLVWGGDDLKVRIKGVPLSMVQIPVPQPDGDLILTYACE